MSLASVRPRLLLSSFAVLCWPACGSSAIAPGTGAPRPADVVVIESANTGTDPKVRACFEGGPPRELGAASFGDVTLSPDGAHVALHRGAAAAGDVVSTVDASVQHLAGQGIDFVSFRWTTDGTRLGYLASDAPYIAEGDGSSAQSIDVSLPAPPPGYQSALDTVEWSGDSSHVAFMTKGVAVLADARTGHGQIVSTKVVEGIGFSPDGATLAVLEEDPPIPNQISCFATGTVLLVRVDTLESREIKSPPTGAVRWSADGNWLLIGSAPVPINGGTPTSLNGLATMSPDATELAFVDPQDGNLHVRNVDGGNDRVLVPGVAQPNVAGTTVVQWAPDSSAVWYLDGASYGTLHVVRASDGAVLLSAAGQGYFPAASAVAFGRDGWIAVDDVFGKSFRTQLLGQGPESGATFSGSDLHVVPGKTLWLENDKIAFAADGAIHIAGADGSAPHTACEGLSLVSPQRLPL